MDTNLLPQPFLAKMQTLLGEEYQDYLDSFQKERSHGLRINRSKVSAQQFEQLVSFPVEPVTYVPGGYTYCQQENPAKDPYYYAGLYYLQEPSAMTPASLLPITPGDRVLDLCAAPGGKSTELGVRLDGQGLLLSNDISNSRAKALLKNLELFGIENICVTSEDSDKLKACFPLFFDKILIDAPCSGEGMFRKDPSMVKDWLSKGPDFYSPIQRQLVEAAADMLKPGGMMLYSTCTFDPSEDEQIISWLLSRRQDLSVVPLPYKEGFMNGFGLEGCVRLFPHRIKGEGHFMALLQKQGEPATCVRTENEKASPLPKELEEFLSLVLRKFERVRMKVIQDMVYYLPEGLTSLPKLRYLRTGLLMGQLKNGRFEPSQALAMTLKKEEFSVVLDLEKQDDRVLRYLKGETLTLDREIRGWCLVCVSGFPLGFGKGTGLTLKNKYYPGWRWM